MKKFLLLFLLFPLLIQAQYRVMGTGQSATYYLDNEGSDLDDELSILVNVEGDATLSVVNPFYKSGALTPNSTTPSISNRSVFLTANTLATAITGFSNLPAASYRKLFYIEIGDDLTTYTHSANLDCGGLNLGPLTGDILVGFWNGTNTTIKFWYIQ